MPYPTQDQGDLLILSLPSNVDLNILADSFVTFIEEEIETLGADVVFTDEPFAWKEVADCQFDEMCASFLAIAGEGPFLQAVWADGRIGIVSATGALLQDDWDRLIEKLRGAQARICDASAWRILKAPRQTTDAAEPAAPLSPLSPADRGQPILASIAQRDAVLRAHAREDGRHGVVAMRPIVLPMPDAEALEATFEALQARHDILNMTFDQMQGLDYIQLSESTGVPFAIVSALRPFRNIDIIAAERTRVLAERPLSDQSLWHAELIQDRSQGIVIAVLSEAIADLRTTELLRAEIIRFYEAVRAGLDPALEWPAPALHYTDYAASEPGFSEACDWWQQFVPDLVSTPEEPVCAPVAPVETFEHHLAPEMLEQLVPVAEATGTTVQTLVLAAFLKTMSEFEAAPLDWVLLALHDRRPSGLEEMLGPFAFDCPIWLGDMHARITPSGLQHRLNDTKAEGAAPLSYLAEVLPEKIPARIRHAFDWRDRAVLVRAPEAAPDVSLCIAQTDHAVHLQWSVRSDYASAAVTQVLAQDFLRHLDTAIRLQDFTFRP